MSNRCESIFKTSAFHRVIRTMSYSPVNLLKIRKFSVLVHASIHSVPKSADGSPSTRSAISTVSHAQQKKFTANFKYRKLTYVSEQSIGPVPVLLHVQPVLHGRQHREKVLLKLQPDELFTPGISHRFRYRWISYVVLASAKSIRPSTYPRPRCRSRSGPRNLSTAGLERTAPGRSEAMRKR